MSSTDPRPPGARVGTAAGGSWSESDEADAVTLRPAEESDAPAVVEVYLAARAAAPMPPESLTESQVGAWVLGWFWGSREPWVAVTGDDAVVGFVLLEDDWLHSLYVAPHAQRHGVGRDLLDLVTSLRPDGFALWVFAGNAPARAFYAAHGLVELETTDGSGNAEGAPEVRTAWLGADPLTWLRAEIDVVDEDLARLLARRTALAAQVQERKVPGGHAGRDRRREAAIAARMAAVAPGPGEAAYARIVDRVVEVGLDLHEATRGSVPPAGAPAEAPGDATPV